MKEVRQFRCKFSSKVAELNSFKHRVVYNVASHDQSECLSPQSTDVPTNTDRECDDLPFGTLL